MSPKDSLWSAPETVLERLSLKGRDTEWTDFLLCGFYCAVAVGFLLLFGIAALLRGETSYALVILGFAATTCLVYGGIWLTGHYHLARHFVVLLMGSLCLFLFHTGGTANTGPVYYFVFPVVALFLQGIRAGSLSVGVLLVLSLVMQETGLFGFDTERYSFVFITRVFSVYLIISILAFLFAWFRAKAERELLLSREDLQSITHADVLTGLANRNFMERLVTLEFERYKRYRSPFCILFLGIDNYGRICQRYGREYGNELMVQVAQFLMETLRKTDIPARWDREHLIIMLPETSQPGGRLMADRIREQLRKKSFARGMNITVSIGLSEIGESPEGTLANAETNLEIASRDHGDSVVAGRQSATLSGQGGLSAHFRTS